MDKIVCGSKQQGLEGSQFNSHKLKCVKPKILFICCNLACFEELIPPASNSLQQSLSRKYLVQKPLNKWAAGFQVLCWHPLLKFMVAPLTSEDPRDPFTPQAPALSWDTSPPFQATWGAWKLRPLSSPLWRACEPVFSMCHSHCHSTAQAPCWTGYQAKSGTSLQGYQFSGLCSQKQRERPAIQECFCYSLLLSIFSSIPSMKWKCKVICVSL